MIAKTNSIADNDFVMHRFKQNIPTEIVEFGYLGTSLTYPYLYPYPLFGSKKYVPAATRVYPGIWVLSIEVYLQDALSLRQRDVNVVQHAFNTTRHD